MHSCPSCGAALPQAAVRFCLTCGHRLTSEGQHAASAPKAHPGDGHTGGQAMRTSLGDVLQLSIAADRDFTAWMQDPQTIQNCAASATQDAHYAAGVQASAQAMQAKQQFLSRWNRIASQSGLPTFSTLDI